MRGILGGSAAVEPPRSPFKPVPNQPSPTKGLLYFHGESQKNDFRPSRRPSTACYASQDQHESMIHVLNHDDDVSVSGSVSASASTTSFSRPTTASSSRSYANNNNTNTNNYYNNNYNNNYNTNSYNSRNNSLNASSSTASLLSTSSSRLVLSPKDKQRVKDEKVARVSIAKDPAPPTPRGGRTRVAPGGPTSIFLG